MNTLDTAEWMDIAGIVILIAILAYMAVLIVLFIRRYKRKVSEREADAFIQADFNCPYARKRVMNRIIHNRKHALFAGNPEAMQGYLGQGSDDIRDIKRYQRGLLKDKP